MWLVKRESLWKKRKRALYFNAFNNTSFLHFEQEAPIFILHSVCKWCNLPSLTRFWCPRATVFLRHPFLVWIHPTCPESLLSLGKSWCVWRSKTSYTPTGLKQLDPSYLSRICYTSLASAGLNHLLLCSQRPQWTSLDPFLFGIGLASMFFVPHWTVS